VKKVVSMLSTGELDAEVVDNQGELDGSGAVGPEGRCARNEGVSILGKMLGETVVCDASGLLESGDALANLHVHPTIGVSEVPKVVQEDDFVGKEGEVHLHVLVTSHGSTIIKICNIHASESRIRSGNYAVDEDFCHGESGTLGGSRSRVVEMVPAGTIADTMCLSFGGANGGFLLAVGYHHWLEKPLAYVLTYDKEHKAQWLASIDLARDRFEHRREFAASSIRRQRETMEAWLGQIRDLPQP
jgi:hypothetical protein